MPPRLQLCWQLLATHKQHCVPQKNDILSQLGSTLLYAGGAWVAFKYSSGFEPLSTAWLYVAAGR